MFLKTIRNNVENNVLLCKKVVKEKKQEIDN